MRERIEMAIKSWREYGKHQSDGDLMADLLEEGLKDIICLQELKKKPLLHDKNCSLLIGANLPCDCEVFNSAGK